MLGVFTGLSHRNQAHASNLAAVPLARM